LSWRWVGNRNSAGGNSSSTSDAVKTAPWDLAYTNAHKFREAISGEKVLWRGGILSTNNITGRQFSGRFDGVFYIPSFSTTPETVVTIGGVDHLVVPNVFRTEDGGMAAFALE
jgi:hypothetical protein